MILNFHDSTKSYTAMMLQKFSNFQLMIDDSMTNLYTIPIVFGSASRLYDKLNSTDTKFKYRTPIMSLEVNLDVDALDRATNPILKRKSLDIDGDSVLISYNDKPMNYTGTITVIADTLTTLTNIVEGVSSAFHNNVVYTDYVSPIGENIRTPIKLVNVEMNIDKNEDIPESGRLLEATFELLVEGVVHSNYQTNSKIIKNIDFVLYDYTVNIDNIIDHYNIDSDD